ncbi:hypothetical protein ACFS07_00275 [Undibacterium arcticum]
MELMISITIGLLFTGRSNNPVCETKQRA